MSSVAGTDGTRAFVNRVRVERPFQPGAGSVALFPALPSWDRSGVDGRTGGCAVGVFRLTTHPAFCEQFVDELGEHRQRVRVRFARLVNLCRQR
jgi:predicted oxidoreductase